MHKPQSSSETSSQISGKNPQSLPESNRSRELYFQQPQQQQQPPSTMSQQPGTQPQKKTATADPLKDKEYIIIHVFDESRKVSKDFQCEKTLLLSQMKYFEKYLKEADSVEEIDISVHCDINIFEWLMKYIKVEKPTLGMQATRFIVQRSTT